MENRARADSAPSAPAPKTPQKLSPTFVKKALALPSYLQEDFSKILIDSRNSRELKLHDYNIQGSTESSPQKCQPNTPDDDKSDTDTAHSLPPPVSQLNPSPDQSPLPPDVQLGPESDVFDNSESHSLPPPVSQLNPSPDQSPLPPDVQLELESDVFDNSESHSLPPPVSQLNPFPDQSPLPPDVQSGSEFRFDYSESHSLRRPVSQLNPFPDQSPLPPDVQTGSGFDLFDNSESPPKVRINNVPNHSGISKAPPPSVGEHDTSNRGEGLAGVNGHYNSEASNECKFFLYRFDFDSKADQLHPIILPNEPSPPTGHYVYNHSKASNEYKSFLYSVDFNSKLDTSYRIPLEIEDEDRFEDPNTSDGFGALSRPVSPDSTRDNSSQPESLAGEDRRLTVTVSNCSRLITQAEAKAIFHSMPYERVSTPVFTRSEKICRFKVDVREAAHLQGFIDTFNDLSPIKGLFHAKLSLEKWLHDDYSEMDCLSIYGLPNCGDTNLRGLLTAFLAGYNLELARCWNYTPLAKDDNTGYQCWVKLNGRAQMDRAIIELDGKRLPGYESYDRCINIQPARGRQKTVLWKQPMVSD